MLCEMCGKDVVQTNQVRVEGSVLSLCPECSRFGTVIGAPPPTPGGAPERGATGPIADRLAVRSRRMEERDLFKELPDMDLASDWSKRIRVAREKLGWTPEDFGKKLNEKKSIVLKMESGSYRPPDAMVPKIEHLLKVRLRAEAGAAP